MKHTVHCSRCTNLFVLDDDYENDREMLEDDPNEILCPSCQEDDDWQRLQDEGVAEEI